MRNATTNISRSLGEDVERLEKGLLIQAPEETGHDLSQAAQFLGFHVLVY